MTQLGQLGDKLKAHGWRVVADLEGEGDTPVIWRIQRKPDKGPYHLEFQATKSSQIGMAFGVRIRELKQTSIYLYRQHNEEAWKRVLDELVAALDELEG